jgi:hypothetical protein
MFGVITMGVPFTGPSATLTFTTPVAATGWKLAASMV